MSISTFLLWTFYDHQSIQSLPIQCHSPLSQDLRKTLPCSSNEVPMRPILPSKFSKWHLGLPPTYHTHPNQNHAMGLYYAIAHLSLGADQLTPKTPFDHQVSTHLVWRMPLLSSSPLLPSFSGLFSPSNSFSFPFTAPLERGNKNSKPSLAFRWGVNIQTTENHSIAMCDISYLVSCTTR